MVRVELYHVMHRGSARQRNEREKRVCILRFGWMPFAHQCLCPPTTPHPRFPFLPMVSTQCIVSFRLWCRHDGERSIQRSRVGLGEKSSLAVPYSTGNTAFASKPGKPASSYEHEREKMTKKEKKNRREREREDQRDTTIIPVVQDML